LNAARSLPRRRPRAPAVRCSPPMSWGPWGSSRI
jgi:hypothetical protein